MKGKYWCQLTAAVFGLAAGIALRQSAVSERRGDAEPSAGLEDRADLTSESGQSSSEEFLDRATRNRPGLAEVVATRGLRQYASMAHFLAGASADECKALHERLRRDGELTIHFKDMIFLRMAEVDPLGGYRLSKSLWAWGKTDPDAALEFALKHGQGAAVLRAIAQEDAQAGRELLAKYPQFESFTVREGLAGGIANQDLRKAAEYALEYGIDRSSALKVWTDRDPDKAVAFALGQTDPGRRSHALEQVISSLGASDPSRAFDLIDGLPAGRMREDLRDRLLRLSLSSDPDAAIARVMAIEDPRERSAVLDWFSSTVAYSRPEWVLAIVAESAEAGERWIKDVRSLARRLADVEPQRTLASLQHLDAGGVNDIVRDVASRWAMVEPESASRWVKDEAGGASQASRDSMVRGLIDGLISSSEPDFESALSWAGGLENHPGTLDRVLRDWIEADEEGARKVILDRGPHPQKVVYAFERLTEAAQP